MKHHKPLIISFLLFVLSLLITTPVQAETKVTTTPKNFIVAGKRCLIANLGCTSTTRYLLLRPTKEVSDLKIITLDLNSTDGAKVFSANSIKVDLSSVSSQVQKLSNNISGNTSNQKPNEKSSTKSSNPSIKVPLEFNFQNTPSGDFNGTLLVIYPDGELTIPLTVKVKDNWFSPLFILLLGVVLGVIVSAYRTEGMARDEVLVQVGRLRTKMRADGELNNSFKSKIDACLVEVETALENKAWKVAKQAVDDAQKIWDKWRKSRTDWIDLINSKSQLSEYLNQENPEDSELKIPYLQNIHWQLQSIDRELANEESPQKLSESLQNMREQLNRYFQGKNQYQQLNELKNQLPESASNQDEFWRLEAINLQQRLHNLSPTDKEAFQKWQDEIKNKSQELLTTIQEKSTPESDNQEASNITRSINNPIPNIQIEPIPQVQGLPDKNSDKNSDKAAHQRLYLFNLVSYGIAIFLLGGAGFSQLYASNKIFGANGLTEYFALLAWGFGAEATRESVTKFLQDWKLSGVNNKS